MFPVKLITELGLATWIPKQQWPKMILYPVYTMKLARRAGSTSARRALVEQLRECLQYYTIQMTR